MSVQNNYFPKSTKFLRANYFQPYQPLFPLQMSGHRFDVEFPLKNSCNCCFRGWHMHRRTSEPVIRPIVVPRVPPEDGPLEPVEELGETPEQPDNNVTLQQ